MMCFFSTFLCEVSFILGACESGLIGVSYDGALQFTSLDNDGWLITSHTASLFFNVIKRSKRFQSTLTNRTPNPLIQVNGTGMM